MVRGVVVLSFMSFRLVGRLGKRDCCRPIDAIAE